MGFRMNQYVCMRVCVCVCVCVCVFADVRVFDALSSTQYCLVTKLSYQSWSHTIAGRCSAAGKGRFKKERKREK
uniref:Putative secreted protein n=1 Tax=Anopheles darlingi TaxID=43151 RepID=A0A2M4DJV4_ANODA